jgi:tetratricopeptide (TPR) repeat protein
MTRAIEIKKKAFAATDPRLATSYSNLALVEQDLGNLAEARRLMRRAYEIRAARLAREHTDTQKTIDWLKANDPDFVVPDDD